MAYCRKSDTSDVYMYGHVDGFIHCALCDLTKTSMTIFNTRSAAIRHLRKHRDYGNRIDEQAIDRLIEEIASKGDTVRKEDM